MGEKRLNNFIYFLNFYIVFASLANILVLLLVSSSEIDSIQIIGKEWKKHPIQEISLIKKEGFEEISLLNWKKCLSNQTEEECNKIKKNGKNITKIKNNTFYVSYYKENYLTLLSRIDSSGNKCKNGFYKCGKLDRLGNIFCKKKEEICPINFLYISFDNNNTLDIRSHNKNQHGIVINGLYLSEFVHPNIFSVENNLTNEKDYNNNLNTITINYPYVFFLEKVENVVLNKSEIFLENQILPKIKIYQLNKNSKLFLFSSFYPEMLSSLNFLDIILSKYYILVLLTIFFFRIILIILLNKYKKKLYTYYRIIWLICNIIFVILSIFFHYVFYKFKKFTTHIYHKRSLNFFFIIIIVDDVLICILNIIFIGFLTNREIEKDIKALLIENENKPTNSIKNELVTPNTPINQDNIYTPTPQITQYN